MGQRIGIWLGPEDEALLEAIKGLRDKGASVSGFFKRAAYAYLYTRGDVSGHDMPASDVAEDIAKRVVKHLRASGLVVAQQQQQEVERPLSEDEEWRRKLDKAAKQFD